MLKKTDTEETLSFVAIIFIIGGISVVDDVYNL